MANQTLALIDANSLLHRAYHALPSLTTPQGEPIGAVYGFASMVLRVLQDLHPTKVVVAWDTKAPTFRHEAYTAYKEHRPSLPDDFKVQKKKAEELLDTFGIKQLGVDGYEADDLIGTLARRGEAAGDDVIIVTGDMDSLQLINQHTKVYTAKGSFNDTQLMDEVAVADRLGGLRPDQVIDYKALRGDPSDNIPGVKGIGDKTAIELLLKYNDLDGVYENLPLLTARQSKLLSEGKEDAHMSQHLARIDCDVPVQLSSEEMVLNTINLDAGREMFTKFGFKSLIKRLEAVASIYGGGQGVLELDLTEEKELDLDGSSEPVDPFEFDVVIAAYLLTGETGNRLDIDSLALRFLGQPVTFNLLTADQQRELVCQIRDAEESEFNKEENAKLRELFYHIEMPLKRVLDDMQTKGVLVDVDTVYSLQKSYETDIRSLEIQARELVGSDFNLNSPKQLEEILFDQLRLPVLKKTKTQRSTDESVLTKLRELHPVIDVLLKYRQLHKIKSTYLDPLPTFLDADHRVHTTFNQTKAASGRLSSENPNLQNIPLDPETGLRRLFMAPEGSRLLIADYSQIELRIMAHLSQDPRLISSFTSEQDIHAATAARIFNKLIDDVSKKERQVGKTINFALMYGITSHGLSDQLGIERVKADLYIDNFYKSYPHVKEWQEKLLNEARITGYVETMYGRRRYLPELTTGAFHQKAGAERIAINHPLQGSQADIIKIAMVQIAKRLKDANLSDSVQMILQIHDELVFEFKNGLEEQVAEIVKEEMEGVVQLNVPIIVEMRAGTNWQDAEKVTVQN